MLILIYIWVSLIVMCKPHFFIRSIMNLTCYLFFTSYFSNNEALELMNFVAPTGKVFLKLNFLHNRRSLQLEHALKFLRRQDISLTCLMQSSVTEQLYGLRVSRNVEQIIRTLTFIFFHTMKGEIFHKLKNLFDMIKGFFS